MEYQNYGSCEPDSSLELYSFLFQSMQKMNIKIFQDPLPKVYTYEV